MLKVYLFTAVMSFADALDLVDGQKRLVTYREWSDLIQSSFEKCYYVPTGSSDPSVLNNV
jgi:glycogen debranching enzyme